MKLSNFFITESYYSKSIQEDDGVNDSGMIGEPDTYYDEEERKQAYNDLQDALDQCNSREYEHVKDGICPECGGSSYMDGDYEGEEDSCYGWGSFGCDEGELEGATWKEIMDHDKRQAERQALKDKPQPKDEDLLKVMDRLHKDYVKTGRVNAYELPGLLRQMYPEVSKPKAREIGSKFFQSFDEAIEETYDCDDAFFEDYGYLGYSIDENDVFEAEYRGRKVKLNKPMQGDVKKFKVYVKDPKTGNVKKVNFGHGGSSVKGKAMKIRKNNPKARKSFRARHNCDNPGPKTKARYWSCRKW